VLHLFLLPALVLVLATKKSFVNDHDYYLSSTRLTSIILGVSCLAGIAGGGDTAAAEVVKLLVLEEVVGAGGTTLDLSRLRAPF
jgi:hypothetical protein